MQHCVILVVCRRRRRVHIIIQQLGAKEQRGQGDTQRNALTSEWIDDDGGGWTDRAAGDAVLLLCWCCV